MNGHGSPGHAYREPVEDVEDDTATACLGHPVVGPQEYTDPTDLPNSSLDQHNMTSERDGSARDTQPSRVIHHHSDNEAADSDRISPTKTQEYVSWSSLPQKTQLAILTVARLSEPLTQTSLQSYMFYQLKSFTRPDGSTPSDSQVAQQAGLLAAAFTGAQCCTAMLWGRLADSERCGRKRVILIGLLGTAVGSLGFGFSDNFAAAMLWRCVGGTLNGNIGVLRTMINEIVKEKKYLSRAFLLLPMTFNIGVIIGPLLGGMLADPIQTYPSIFGPGGALGGTDGVWLFKRWPYALPGLVMAAFLLLSALGVFFGLQETLIGLKDNPDYGLACSRWFRRVVLRSRAVQGYAAVPENETMDDIELNTISTKPPRTMAHGKLPFHQIWTSNLLFTLLSHGLLAMHVGTFSNLWFVFLSTPRYLPHGDIQPSFMSHLPPDYKPRLPFTFTGGLGLSPPAIGLALSILGVIGISLQLVVYPYVSFRLGAITSYRWSLVLFPFTYFLTPYLSTIPSNPANSNESSGLSVWAAITALLAIQVLARTFALPATALLVNSASPHPSVLGTVHGSAQTASSGTRTIGPVLGGWIYGLGLDHGVVGLAWWCMSVLAAAGAIAGCFVKEGDGHEIWLPGDRVEEENDR